MQSNRTVCVTMYKIKVFGEKIVCVIVSTFLVFMFVDQLLVVHVFSQLYLYQPKNNVGLSL